MNGIQLIRAERNRQIKQEKWSGAHDDTLSRGELARAAACYTLNGLAGSTFSGAIVRAFREDIWPWSKHWWKPADRIRELAKAGALIAAEIDRIQRKV